MAKQQRNNRNFTPATKISKKKGPPPRREADEPRNPGRRLKSIWKQKGTDLPLKAWARKQKIPLAQQWLLRKTPSLAELN